MVRRPSQFVDKLWTLWLDGRSVMDISRLYKLDPKTIYFHLRKKPEFFIQRAVKKQPLALPTLHEIVGTLEGDRINPGRNYRTYLKQKKDKIKLVPCSNLKQFLPDRELPSRCI